MRLLTRADAGAFQALRLAALRDAPTAFGASLEEESDLDLDAVAARIQPHNDDDAVYGAYVGADLVAVAGIWRERLRKMRHKAHVWTMYVMPAHRGAGLGAQLMQRIIEHARALDGVRCVLLEVTAANVPAIALYRALGFVEYGHEPLSIHVEGLYHDGKLMMLELQEE